MYLFGDMEVRLSLSASILGPIVLFLTVTMDLELQMREKLNSERVAVTLSGSGIYLTFILCSDMQMRK